MSWCHTCDRRFDYRGIPRHRAMHRDRKEDCTITLKSGTWLYRYAERQPAVDAESTEPEGSA